MAGFRVEIVPRVYDQIREQVHFIANDSIDSALAWEDRLLTALGRLAE